MVNLLGVGEGEIENKKSSSCVPCLLSISPHLQTREKLYWRREMSQQETSSSSSSSTAVATGENASQHGIVGETFTEKFKRKFKAQPLVPM